MRIADFVKEFENAVPLMAQESYDNCGLQIGNPGNEIQGILYTLDVNARAVDAAMAGGCNLIISHHPFIFGGLKSIDLSKYNGSIINSSISRGISIYSAHTNFDKSPKGVSAELAGALGLENYSVLVPEKNVLKKLATFCPVAQADTVRNALFNAGAGNIGQYDSCSFNVAGSGTFKGSEETHPFAGSPGKLHVEPEIRIEVAFPAWKQSEVISALLAYHPYEEVAYDIYSLENAFNGFGLGMIGTLPQRMNEMAFIDKVKNSLNARAIRSSMPLNMDVRKVAVCGGSGSEFISTAIEQGAQAYITADLKYHDFQKASGKILLIDAGHYETEIFTLNALKSLVSEILPNFAPQIIFPDSNWVNTV